MRKFISKVQNLTQKAAELKAAMQQMPPKIAEVRQAMSSTADQLHQLKSEIQFSVADLKAEHEGHLSAALAEVSSSTEIFAKAGYELSGVDLEISPVQRALVHLTHVEDVPDSALRVLIQNNPTLRTTRAILSSLLQAQQMAETVELGGLIYDEVIVGIGPIPNVRLCWRPEVVAAPAVPPIPTIGTAAPAVAAASSAFQQTGFFEKRAAQPQATVSVVSETPSPVVAAVKAAHAEADATPAAPENVDPLARFKKMPSFSKYGK